MIVSCGDVVDEFACHGHFAFRLFAEANADGVADAFGKECSDADSRFDAAVLAVACFGNAKV